MDKCDDATMLQDGAVLISHLVRGTCTCCHEILDCLLSASQWLMASNSWYKASNGPSLSSELLREGPLLHRVEKKS